MSLPQSSNSSNGNRIVPFSTNKESGSHTKKIFPSTQRPSWIQKVSKPSKKNSESTVKLTSRKLYRSNVIQLKIKSTFNFLNSSFFHEKQRIESDIRGLFNFLTNKDVFGKINLIEKLNFKITSGEITTIDQLKSFFDKAYKLAECMRVYLLKHEYSENFMRKISFDVFENGFNSENQENGKNNFSNFFAENKE
ncbi:MAG: hypothetical protein C5B43_04340 [Verrucomicrobia bacterium]|nr:MAG: hypothetical protein C5B43_04340 [Verrucomicrobiota bacterium]